jgi:hypothetical protein
MYVLSFAPNDCGIAIDADLRYLSGFILEQVSAEKKAIKEGNPQNRKWNGRSMLHSSLKTRDFPVPQLRRGIDISLPW